ncbi:hypothetical protein E8E12_009859 [Didymella heteroderae]|uniref:Uncharacterized protein n=1 Tax=Didymella heteroderae TaxID=1769908 RepID=A0A9P5C395_9PLEO|nr:hypothetical protein E8E12_009859 [Didymella heteroderae]
MFELAVAEAYRPRPRPRPQAAAHQQSPPAVARRPATFATNPKARASISSSRPRPPSTPSRNAIVTSHSRFFISFISRRGRPGSLSSSSDRTITPQDAVRADSVISRATATSTTDALPERKKGDRELSNLDQAAVPSAPHTCPSSARSARVLPALPPPVPLPPQEELNHFDTALQSAIEDLQSTESLSQGSDLVLRVLEHMAHVSDLASCVATSWAEFYALLLHAANLIVSVLLVREVLVRNVLVKSLGIIARRWTSSKRRDTAELARVAGSVFDSVVQERSLFASRLGREFARWLRRERDGPRRQGGRLVRILTLGVSRAVSAGLQYALAEDADLEIHLEALTALDQGMPSPPLYERLQITVHSTSAIGTASQRVDVLLLEPSCIGPTGDLGCQNGALGTAVCVKALCASAKVVALSDVDTIAISAGRRQAAGESGGGIDATPERVPSRFVDVYIAEYGALDAEALQRLAVGAEELDQHILEDEAT